MVTPSCTTGFARYACRIFCGASGTEAVCEISSLTATLVPAAPGTARATATSGTDKLEALDHGRGIADKKD